ncbi:MAG: hypothetical protein KJZ75_11175 [Hyphomonadaceae bacterium]|nr:hypothetical protein [Hyphomonadaceae bacterium]
MTQQDNAGALVIYGAQAALGTPATAGGTSQYLRRVMSSLNFTRDPIISKEVRPDFQKKRPRLGAARVSGAISGEVSLETHDDFYEALFRSTWAAGVALDESDFTSLTIASGVITFGSGSPITLGLKVGDIIRLTGMSVSANNNKNARITALTSTTVTVNSVEGTPVLADNATDTECDLVVVGRKLILGVERPLFTIEHNFPTKDLSKVFEDCRVGGASVNLPASGEADVSFDFMGRWMNQVTSGSAPYFTDPTEATTTEMHTGMDGAIRVAGSEQAIITGLSFQISHNLSIGPAIGTRGKGVDVFYGDITVQGQLTAYIDSSLASAFLNETECDIVAAVNAAGNEPQGFHCWNMQSVTLLGATEQLEAQGGVISTHPFQAGIKTGGTETAYDQTTISLQVSNS